MRYLCVHESTVTEHPHLLDLLRPIANLRRIGPGQAFYAVPESHPNIEFVLVMAHTAGWVHIQAETPTLAIKVPHI